MRPKLESLSILIYPTGLDRRPLDQILTSAATFTNQRVRQIFEGSFTEHFPEVYNLSAIPVKGINVAKISAGLHTAGWNLKWIDTTYFELKSLPPTEQILFDLTTERSLRNLELTQKCEYLHKIPERIYTGIFPYILISTIVSGRGSNQVF